MVCEGWEGWMGEEEKILCKRTFSLEDHVKKNQINHSLIQTNCMWKRTPIFISPFPHFANFQSAPSYSLLRPPAPPPLFLFLLVNLPWKNCWVSTRKNLMPAPIRRYPLFIVFSSRWPPPPRWLNWRKAMISNPLLAPPTSIQLIQPTESPSACSLLSLLVPTG